MLWMEVKCSESTLCIKLCSRRPRVNNSFNWLEFTLQNISFVSCLLFPPCSWKVVTSSASYFIILDHIRKCWISRRRCFFYWMSCFNADRTRRRQATHESGRFGEVSGSPRRRDINMHFDNLPAGICILTYSCSWLPCAKLSWAVFTSIEMSAYARTHWVMLFSLLTRLEKSFSQKASRRVCKPPTLASPFWSDSTLHSSPQLLKGFIMMWECL